MSRVLTWIGRFLWTNLRFILFLVVLESWPLLTGTPLTMRTALALAGLYVVLAVRGTEKASWPKPAERIFVPAEAVLEVSRLTGYELLSRMTPYLGKWITVSGTFDGTGESLPHDAIHLSLLLDDGRRFNLRFSTDRAEDLRTLRTGQRITVIGEVQFSGYSLMPENCELISAAAVRQSQDVRRAQPSRRECLSSAAR